MGKHWYIYRKDHHLGPFTASNLRELYLRGSLTSFEQIWRQGDEGWLALSDYRDIEKVFALKDDRAFIEAYDIWSVGGNPFLEQMKKSTPALEDCPPDLPPLPIWDEEQSEEAEVITNVPMHHHEEEIVVPDLPAFEDEDEAPAEDGEEESEEYDEEYDEEYEHEYETYEDEELSDDKTGEFQVASIKKRRRWPFVVLVLTPFVLLALSIFIVMQLEEDRGVDQLSFVAPSFIQKDLWGTIKSPKNSSKIKIVMDNSGKQMWLVSNFPYQAKVELVFSSISKQILSEDDVRFRTQIKLENHVGKISKIVYEKGDKLVPGSYRVTMKGERVGLLAKLFAQIYRPGIRDYLKVIYDPHLQFYSTTTAFVAHGTPDQFKKQLSDFFHRKKMERLAPYREWLQKFKTLSSALDQFKSIINNHIPRYQHYRDREYFERDYSALVGGLVQNLIVSEQKNESRVSPEDPLFSYQKKFVAYAIDCSKLGGEAAAALEKKKKRFHNKWKDAFKYYFFSKINKIQRKVDTSSKEIADLYSKL